MSGRRPSSGALSARRRPLVPALLVAVGLVLVTGGCAAQSPDLERAAADRMQAAVLILTRAAAQERYDAATSAARQVRAELDRAARRGEVSVTRYRQIEEALSRAEAEVARLADTGQPVPGTPPVDEGQEAPLADAAPDGGPAVPSPGTGEVPQDQAVPAATLAGTEQTAAPQDRPDTRSAGEEKAGRDAGAKDKSEHRPPHAGQGRGARGR